jgi:hypothetical protein
MKSDNGGARPRQGRAPRSRLAKPLLTSVGVLTLLATSALVVLGVAATGSARPWDWTRADPAAALSRYNLCGGHGVGALGCMLSAGVRPAEAAPGPAEPPVRQPPETVVTVQDRPAATPTARPTASARPVPAVSSRPPGSAPPGSPPPHPFPSETPEPGDTR